MYTGWCAIYVFLRSSTVFHILICFLIVLHIAEIINIYLYCISPVPPHSILFYCVYYLSVVKMWQHPYYTNPQVTKKHETTGSDRFSIALPFSKIILSHEAWFKQHIILIFVHLKQRRKKCASFTAVVFVKDKQEMCTVYWTAAAVMSVGLTITTWQLGSM